MLTAGRLDSEQEGRGIIIFFKIYRSNRGSNHPPIQNVPTATSPGLNRPGPKADHSPPSSLEVKQYCRCICTPPLCPKGVQKYDFSFVFTVHLHQTLEEKLKIFRGKCNFILDFRFCFWRKTSILWRSGM